MTRCMLTIAFALAAFSPAQADVTLRATAEGKGLGMSGSTSQLPLARTPPQGPFLSCLGQFIGHDMPVDERMHWPHMRQSNMKPLTRFSTNFTGASTRP